MNSKILASLMVIAVVGAVAGAGTFAFFSDTETSDDNTFTAGTMDLTVDSVEDPSVWTFTATAGDLKPTDTDYHTFTLENVGTITGFASMEIPSGSLADDGNSVEEPEDDAGDPSDGSGEGELDDQLQVTIYFEDGTTDGYQGTEDTLIVQEYAKDLPKDKDLLDDTNSYVGSNTELADGATEKIGVQYTFVESGDNNKAQGDEVSFDILFDLAQSQGNY